MLTNFPLDPYLDMPAWRGQRVERFRFEWKNAITGETLGWLTPEKEPVPLLTHNTSISIKRTLSLDLGTFDTSQVNALTDRILLWVDIGGTTYPLGRYMFTSETDLKSTRGDRGTFRLLDEGFIIEQQISQGFASLELVDAAVFDLLTGLPLVSIDVEATNLRSTGSWSVGTNRGQIMEAYATQGDYFPYWLGNDQHVHMIRTIDPAVEVPDFDYDAGFAIRRDSINITSDVLFAPNRFVVISNSGAAETDPLVGTYDVPPSAPHSIAQRGFVIQQTDEIQLGSQEQVAAAARNIGIRQTIFERATFITPIDPRHDSYNVAHLAGDKWLEIAWSMELIAGGVMEHTMRKAYV